MDNGEARWRGYVVLCYVDPVLPSRRTRLCMDPTHSPTLSLRSCCCCSLFFSITPSFNLINQTARLVPRRRFLQSSQQHSDGGAVAVGGKNPNPKVVVDDEKSRRRRSIPDANKLGQWLETWHGSTAKSRRREEERSHHFIHFIFGPYGDTPLSCPLPFTSLHTVYMLLSAWFRLPLYLSRTACCSISSPPLRRTLFLSSSVSSLDHVAQAPPRWWENSRRQA